MGMQTYTEAFIDRKYQKDGTLVPRREHYAVIHDPATAKEQVDTILTEQKVLSHDGFKIELVAQTFCIHGDNPNALDILQYLRKDHEQA